MRENELAYKLNHISKGVREASRQTLFLDCRIQAMEAVLMRRAAPLLLIICPSRVMRRIDVLSLQLLQDRTRQPEIIQPTAIHPQAVTNGR